MFGDQTWHVYSIREALHAFCCMHMATTDRSTCFVTAVQQDKLMALQATQMPSSYKADQWNLEYHLATKLTNICYTSTDLSERRACETARDPTTTPYLAATQIQPNPIQSCQPASQPVSKAPGSKPPGIQASKPAGSESSFGGSRPRIMAAAGRQDFCLRNPGNPTKSTKILLSPFT
jgi:hypothetical protein